MKAMKLAVDLSLEDGALVEPLAVALPGAVMPGGQKLGKAKLRGGESLGMVLSASELELAEESEGIMVLADDLAAGTPVLDVLPPPGTILELELTPNRGDCQGIYGIAREVHAITGAPLHALDTALPPEDGAGTVGDYVSLRVEAPDLCPRYMARVLLDVRVGPSPDWMVRRLEAAGMRSINNVVDITNYVLHDLGQPLHAFDADRIGGNTVRVRRAAEGEAFTALDGKALTLSSADLVIADAERPMCLAGVYGGQDSGVTEATTRVFLESAWFEPVTIRKSAKRHTLSTDASFRFERGVDPKTPWPALQAAVTLLCEHAGAEVDGGVQAFDPALIGLVDHLDAGRPKPHLALADDDAGRVERRIEQAIAQRDGQRVAHRCRDVVFQRHEHDRFTFETRMLDELRRG